MNLLHQNADSNSVHSIDSVASDLVYLNCFLNLISRFLHLVVYFMYNSYSILIDFYFFGCFQHGKYCILVLFYVFLFGFNFLSTSWLPLFPILIWVRSVFLPLTKKIEFS